MGSVPGWGRFPGQGHGNPLQYSCLGNPMDRGAWRATVHKVGKSQTRLKYLSAHTPLWPWCINDLMTIINNLHFFHCLYLFENTKTSFQG